jgi:hypothetical protein
MEDPMPRRQPIREHTGISFAIVATIVSSFAILPAAIAVAVYTFLTIYAIVKGLGSAPASASALTVLVGVVAIVSAFTVLIAGVVTLLGRSMNPRKRKKP